MKTRDSSRNDLNAMKIVVIKVLNMGHCKYLIEYEPAISYAVQTQRHGRLERADSLFKDVTVYQLVAKNSWDEIQRKIIEKKEGFDESIIKSIAR